MTLKIVFICLVYCVVLAKTKDCEEKSAKDCCEDVKQNPTEIKRFKRAKYYSSPPPGATIRYIRRPPPYGFPQKISYTPPPNYVREEDDMPYPPRPPHGNTPNGGLRDEDINNIVKYLSKQDLDKIIEFASEKERDSLPAYKKITAPKESDDYEYARQQFNENINNFKPQTNGPADEKFSLNGPFVSAAYSNNRPYQNEYDDNPSTNLVQDANQPKAAYVNAPQNVYYNAQLDTQESMQYQKVAHSSSPYTGHVNGRLNNMVSNSNQDESTGNKNEEVLPKPVNLREESDNEGAYTGNVASVATADSGYKVENLGSLPVMDYHSKMFQTNSYNVPHYFVTSNPKSSASTPPVEPAPPPQAARDQSDAHLKAIKIWSHRSRGQAYTLHDDGTLSVERPLRPKAKYGYP